MMSASLKPRPGSWPVPGCLLRCSYVNYRLLRARLGNEALLARPRRGAHPHGGERVQRRAPREALVRLQLILQEFQEVVERPPALIPAA